MQSLESLRGIHAGQTVMVLGAGPSLCDLDEAELKEKPSIGVNRVTLPTTYWMALDQAANRQDWFDHPRGGAIRIISRNTARGMRPESPESLVLDYWSEGWQQAFFWKFRKRGNGKYYAERNGNKAESDTPRMSVGRTSVFSAIDLALFMGAWKVELIGCDFCFAGGKRYYDWPEGTAGQGLSKGDKIGLTRDRSRKEVHTSNGLMMQKYMIELGIKNYRSEGGLCEFVNMSAQTIEGCVE